MTSSFVNKDEVEGKQTVLTESQEEKKVANKLPVVVAIHLAALQQISGINAIAIYGGDIASKAV